MQWNLEMLSGLIPNDVFISKLRRSLKCDFLQPTNTLYDSIAPKAT